MSTAMSLDANTIDFDAWRRNIRETTFANYHYEMARGLEREGSMDMALQACERAIQTRPAWAMPWHAKIRLLETLGRSAEAMATRQSALAAVSSFDQEVRRTLAGESLLEARARLVVQDLAGAIPFVEAAEILREESAEVWALVAAGQRSAGRPDEAEATVRHALALDPHCAPAMVELAGVNVSRGEFASARRIVEQAITMAPASSSTYALVAYVQNVLLDFDAGGRSAQRAFALSPADSYAVTLAGQAALAGGRYDDARAIFEGLLAKIGRDWSLLCFTGLTLQAQGDVHGALALYCEAVSKTPDTLFYYALSYKGLGLLQAGQRASAIEHLRRAVALNPEGAWQQTNLAAALLQEGDSAGAHQALRAALDADPWHIPMQLRFRPWLADELAQAFAAIGAPIVTTAMANGA